MGPEEKRALLKRLLAERAAAGVGDFALTHGQRALWFLQQLVPRSYAYNIGLALQFRPGLDPAVLQRALDRLVERHAALRTIFPAVEGQPVQRVLPPSATTIRIVDMGDATDDDVYHAVVAEHQQPFTLETRTFGVTLFRRAGDDTLLLDMHHIVVDAWSLTILFADLHAFYDADFHGKPAALKPLGARYSDFVAAESRLLASPRAAELCRYWSRTLAGELPTVGIPGDRPTTAKMPLAGASVPFTISTELSSAIYALAKTRGTTMYAIMLVATQLLLHHFSDQSDVIVGTPIALRAASDFTNVVGYFVNTLPLRGTVRPDDTLADLLDAARAQLIGALDHQAYPFSLLVDRLQVARDTTRNPIFQVMLNVLVSNRSSVLWRLLAGYDEQPVAFGSSHVVPYLPPQQEGQFELTVEVMERDGVLCGNLRYQTALYSEARATEIRDGFVALLGALVVNPSARVADLDIPDREQFEL
jgi:hypothetical protein